MFSLSSRLDNMVKSKGSAGIIGVPFAAIDVPTKAETSDAQRPVAQTARKSALDLSTLSPRNRAKSLVSSEAGTASDPTEEREKSRNIMSSELRRKLESGVIFSGQDDSTVLSSNISAVEKSTQVASLTYKLLALTKLTAAIDNSKFDQFKDDVGNNN